MRRYPKPKLWYPKNPQKYTGDPNNIWVRSSWELRVYKWVDTNPDIISWSSEELYIQYISPVDNRWHKYYPDLLVQTKTASGRVKTQLIEIKPYAQTIPPKVQKRITKNYVNEVCTWGVNSAKWEAARAYCRERKWTFSILTENEMFKKIDK